MNFLAPWLLLGGLAVSVPIILHFFYKARYRKQPWAPMRFLRQAVEQTSRRLKFQEYLLLALRCLLLLLLALALSRPTFKTLTAGGRGESIDAVFVFDTSYSMGAKDGEQTRMDRAKSAALAVLDNLPPNSTVQIFTCSDRTTFLGPQSPGNLDQARQAVQNLELSSLSGDVLPGLAEAYSALDRGAGSNKEVYLFSDLQKSGWDRQSAAVKAKAAEIKQRATFVVIRCGNPDRPINNAVVAELTYPGGIPHTGSRMPVTVLVKNTGKNPVRNLTVTLEVDGRLQEKETATIDEIGPGQTFPASLTAKLDEAGPRLLTARLTGDDLPGDNRLDRLVPVRDKVRVLVVDGSPDPRDPKQSAGHFLRNALLPVPANVQDEYFVKVTTVPVEEAGPGLLGVTDVCFLANVASSNADRPGIAGLSPEFVARLAQFVKDGGGLVIGVGDHLIASRYNAVLGSSGARLLPFDLDDPAVAPAERPFIPAPDSTETPSFLARFRDEPFRTVTADAEVGKVVVFREADRSGGRVLMRLTDQKPWLAARTVGDGEVIFVGTSLDGSWTNWPAKAGSYLSFVQFTLAHLTSRGARGGNLTAGETITYNPSEAAKGFDLVRPDGKRTSLGPARGGENGSKLVVSAPDAAVAGVYRISPSADDPPSGPRFAVAADLRESDALDSLTDAEAEQAIGFRPVLLLAGSETDDSVTAERGKREWTVWVLLLVFLVGLVESGWAWFCGRAW